MKALVMGGTAFVGRAVVERLRGNEITLFHRGRSMPGLFPDFEHVIGDRDDDVDALKGRTFDVVHDPGAFELRHVRFVAALDPKRYVFVSTISVYADHADMDESAPTHSLENAENARLSLETYGGLKAACERALDAMLPKRVLHVRAGLIEGPHDYDPRFAWWLRRVAKGGEVLAPGDPNATTQFVDVRDLADFMVTTSAIGPVNVTGKPVRMGDLFDAMKNATGSNARFTWVPDEVLVRHEVGPYSEMPFWLPASLGAKPVPIDRAIDAGLKLRPFEETVRDTWAWLQSDWASEASVRENRRMRIPAGISEDRERLILEEARASHPAKG